MPEESYLVKLVADRKAAEESKRVIEGVKTEFKQLGTVGQEVGKRLGEINRTAKIDALGTEFGKLARKIKDTDEAAKQLRDRLYDVGASSDEIRRATDAFASSGGGTRGSALRLLGSQGRALPSMQIPGLGIGTDQVSNIVRMGGALAELTEKMGISERALKAGAGAAALLAAALLILSVRFRDVKAAADAELNARESALRLLQKGNAEEIQLRINELAEKRRINELIAKDSNASLQALRDGIRQQFGDIALAQSEINATLGTGAGELASAKEQASEANQALQSTSVELELLTNISGLSAQSTADLAEQEANLNYARERAVQLGQDVSDRLNAELEVQRFLKTASVESLDARKQALDDEIASTAAAIDELGKLALAEERGSEAFELLRKQTESLVDKYDSLRATQAAFSDGLVEEAARRNDAMKAQKDAAKDLAKVDADVSSAISKQGDDLKKIADKYAESFTKLAEAYKMANDEANRRAAEEIAKTGRTRADKDLESRLELDRKLDEVNKETADKLVAAETKRQETLEKIRNEFALSEANAIQDRNAVALDAAQRKRDADLAEAEKQKTSDIEQIQESAEARRKEIEADFKFQQEQTKRQRAAEDRERQIAWRNEAEQRRRKLHADQDQLSAAMRNDLLQRNQAYRQQITDLRNYLVERINIDQGYFGQVLAYAQQTKDRLNTILGLGSRRSTIPPADRNELPPQRAPGAPPMTPFATGGYTRYGGMALLHPGEMVLNRRQQAGLGGITLNVSGLGMGRQAVIREVSVQLGKVLDAAGM